MSNPVWGGSGSGPAKFHVGHRCQGCSTVQAPPPRAPPASQGKQEMGEGLAGGLPALMFTTPSLPTCCLWSCSFRCDGRGWEPDSLFYCHLSLPVWYPRLFCSHWCVRAGNIPDSEWDVSVLSMQNSQNVLFAICHYLMPVSLISRCHKLPCESWMREWENVPQRQLVLGEGCNSSWLRPIFLSPFIKGRDQNLWRKHE